MKIVEGIELKENKGKFCLVYGAIDTGKSTSCIASMPKNLFVFHCEKRNPDSSLEAIEESENPNIRNEVTFGLLENYQELLEVLHNQILPNTNEGIFTFNGKEYRSLLIDSLSHFLNVEILTNMENQTKQAKIFTVNRELIDSYRLDEASYGALASIGHRVCDVLKMISQRGVFVVCTAYGTESPKWNRSLVYAPLFAGKKFGNEFGVHFDIIGLVQQKIKKQSKDSNEIGEIVYPPNISFLSPEGNFVAKWTGRKLKHHTGILDFRKIFPQ